MAERTYYVVNDGFDRWGVRLNEDETVTACKHQADAVMTARRFAERDHRNGHQAQVQVQTELGFEIDWRYGAPVA
jgi:hypothetical protein